MNYEALKAEVLDDPLGVGYSSMTDDLVAAALNVVNRTRNRQSMSASEVLNAVDVADYNGLTNAAEAKLWDLLGIGDLNPFGVEATLMVQLFGAGSATITELQALRVEVMSRAVELNMLGASAEVGPSHIAIARAP